MPRVLVVLMLMLCSVIGTPVRAQPAEDPLAFNAWCFNTLLNLGARHGFSDPYYEQMAGHAMAATRARMTELASQQGLDAAAFEVLDMGYFEETRAGAKAFAAGESDAAFDDRYDRCRAKGLEGIATERRHGAFLEQYGEQIWCLATFRNFLARQMIRTEERTARAAVAVGRLRETLEAAFLWARIGLVEREALVARFDLRTVLQVEGFRITGDKARFERDYELCFAMADLPPPTPRFELPPAAIIRPSRSAEAWDYPLSFDFRFQVWCEAAMMADDPVRLGMIEETVAEVNDYIERKVGAEAALLGMSAQHLAVIRADSLAQVRHEFAREAETGSWDVLSYDPGQCLFLGVEEHLDDLFGDDDFGL